MVLVNTENDFQRSDHFQKLLCDRNASTQIEKKVTVTVYTMYTKKVLLIFNAAYKKYKNYIPQLFKIHALRVKCIFVFTVQRRTKLYLASLPI